MDKAFGPKSTCWEWKPVGQYILYMYTYIVPPPAVTSQHQSDLVQTPEEGDPAVPLHQ